MFNVNIVLQDGAGGGGNRPHPDPEAVYHAWIHSSGDPGVGGWLGTLMFLAKWVVELPKIVAPGDDSLRLGSRRGGLSNGKRPFWPGCFTSLADGRKPGTTAAGRIRGVKDPGEQCPWEYERGYLKTERKKDREAEEEWFLMQWASRKNTRWWAWMMASVMLAVFVALLFTPALARAEGLSIEVGHS